jgi:hypothetical protein
MIAIKQAVERFIKASGARFIHHLMRFSAARRSD